MVAAVLFFCLLAGVQAHTFFQKVSVNGVDQGDTFGVRIPNLNWPITTVDDPNFACNKDITTKDNNIITIPQGGTVGTWWDHAIGGGQGPNDPDSPVAPSHKGPLLAYLARVDDPTTGDGTGLQWFKVAHEGFNNGLWAVDNLKTNGGWWSFTMPTCVPPGKYLMRVELIALHGAFQVGGAQFYTECAQIKVTGSGGSTPATVSFPGAYSATDPGIYVSIYDGNGAPTNEGRPYTIPGPAPLDCSNSGSASKGSSSVDGRKSGGGSSSLASPTTMATVVVSASTSVSGNDVASATAVAASPSSVSHSHSGGTTNTGGTTNNGGFTTSPVGWSGGSPGGGSMEQCGGDGWTGTKTCTKGACTVLNQWVSLCM